MYFEEDNCTHVYKKSVLFYCVKILKERVQTLESHVEEARKRMLQMELLKQVRVISPTPTVAWYDRVW